MRCGARPAWARLEAARPGCWLLPFLKCRSAGPMTSASVRMRFALRLRSIDRSTIVFIWRSDIASAATLVTADTRFANAVAATEHGGAVLLLTNLLKSSE